MLENRVVVSFILKEPTFVPLLSLNTVLARLERVRICVCTQGQSTGTRRPFLVSPWASGLVLYKRLRRNEAELFLDDPNFGTQSISNVGVIYMSPHVISLGSVSSLISRPEKRVPRQLVSLLLVGVKCTGLYTYTKTSVWPRMVKFIRWDRYQTIFQGVRKIYVNTGYEDSRLFIHWTKSVGVKGLVEILHQAGSYRTISDTTIPGCHPTSSLCLRRHHRHHHRHHPLPWRWCLLMIPPTLILIQKIIIFDIGFKPPFFPNMHWPRKLYHLSISLIEEDPNLKHYQYYK